MTTTAARPSQTVQLQNPEASNYDTFIVGNSVAWQVRAMVELEQTLPPEIFAELQTEFNKSRPAFAFAENPTFHDFVEPFARKYVVQQGGATGQHLVLCGAGPSLNEYAADYCGTADQVWACNSALTHLLKRGHRVTHGFAVDQTTHMVAEWASAPEVDYLVASTVHPHLMDLLRGKGRNVTMFHNYCGIKKPPVEMIDENGVHVYQGYEEWLYTILYPSTIMAGSGLNAVTRALDVAEYMGFEKITVLGADCSMRVRGTVRTDLEFNSPKHLKWLRNHTVMHADGGHALASEATPVTMHAMIDAGTDDETVRPGHGKLWMTKPDMAISAQWLMRMARRSHGKIELVGDTLPNALKLKNEAYLRKLPNFAGPDGTVINLPEG